MQPVLSFENLARPLDQEGRMVKASAQLDQGSLLRIKGPSGSGKSTLLRMLGRLLTAHQGEMYLKGCSWRSVPPFEWRKSVQYVGQKPILFPLAIEDNLFLPFTLNSQRNNLNYSRSLALDYLAAAGLAPQIMSQPASTLSGGEAARVALIRALLIDPAVMLLDEPMAYLDDENRHRVVQILKRWLGEQSQRGIVMVSHQEEDLELIGSGPEIDLAAPRKVDY